MTSRHLSIARILGLVFLSGALVGAAPSSPRYVEGQIWEYHARPTDKGSLLKIQKIEQLPEFAKDGSIYHVSIIGLHFDGLPIGGELQHAPFSKAALDASVTKLSSSKAAFPDASDGIIQWRQAKGGVFTVSVAEAVDFAERTMRQQMADQPNGG